MDASLSSGADLPFTYRHDSAKTDSDVERLRSPGITPVDEFCRPKIPEEPSFCVENGCNGVLGRLEGRRERVEVKLNDSGSTGHDFDARGSGHLVHRCDTTANNQVSRLIGTLRLVQLRIRLHAI